MLEGGEVPLFRDAVDRVRWKPEPPGDECFDHAKVVLGRGWGDCDDLAPWHAASLRVTGEDPEAKAIVKRSGPQRWHAVVQRGDGSIDDPSREAGMGQHGRGVMGAKLPLMMPPGGAAVVGGTFQIRPQLALRPVRDRSGSVEAWQARADLPWHWAPGRSPTDVAMVSLHASPISSQSIVGACDGLIRLGEANDVDDDVLDRAAAIRDACDGATWEDLADEYGEDHATAAGQLVHGFFTRPISGASYVAGETGTPINRWPGDAKHLGEVFWRFARGEQPRERGGKNYTLKELQYATHNENLYRATLSPEALAARKAMFAREGNAAHQARREARQFGNVVSRVVATPLNVASHIPGVSNVLQAASPLLNAALPLARTVLPFIPGAGTLASTALQMASPMLQNVLQQGLHLPPGQQAQPSGFGFGGLIPGMAAFG
jgi:hypothetical protein